MWIGAVVARELYSSFPSPFSERCDIKKVGTVTMGRASSQACAVLAAYGEFSTIYLFHTSIVAPLPPQLYRIQLRQRRPRTTETTSDSPMFSSPSFASATATTPRTPFPGLGPQLLDPLASPWAVAPSLQQRQQVERTRARTMFTPVGG